MRARSLRGTPSLDALIVALCHDYRRRAEIIKAGSRSVRTLLEMEYLNARIYNAAAELTGDELADIYIEEIGEGVGYAKSRDSDASETSYKLHKMAIKENIAKSLYLE